MKMFDGHISINKAENSPFWMVSFRSADGKQKRRSTKVPVGGELIERNPWRNLRVPQDQGAEKHRREAFTLEELRYIIEKFPPEWSSAVRCSYETFGQRLGDVLALRWGQFDWERRVVRFVTGKTGRVLEQPMRDGFYAYVSQRFGTRGFTNADLQITN